MRPSDFGPIFPIVDSVSSVSKICSSNSCKDVQLRLKITDEDEISRIISESSKICKSSNVRLWINDHPSHAIKHNCFGVHLGQEDIKRLGITGLLSIQKSSLALGISTHTFSELSLALGLNPTYVSLGPIFPTSSKTGIVTTSQSPLLLKKWRELIGPSTVMCAIGGVSSLERAEECVEAGADFVGVIGAVKEDVGILKGWGDVLERKRREDR